MQSLVGPVQVTEKKVTVVFKSSNAAKANMFRRAILSEIETYAIDIVTIYHNTSALEDEKLALILGQIVIDNSKYNKGDNYTFHIDWEANNDFRSITTNDIPQLPFMYVTPITVLPPQGHIIADVTVKRGNGRIHCKWRAISTCAMKEQPAEAGGDGFLFTFYTIGMLDGPTIVREGLAKMDQAMLYQPKTIFSRPVLDDESYTSLPNYLSSLKL